MPLSDHIQQFLQQLSQQKRYSANTVKSYENDLMNFKDYLETQYPDTQVAEITLPQLKSWLASLKAENLEARSINRKMSSLRSFFKFLLRMGIVKSNIAISLTTLRTKKMLPTFVEERQMDRLLVRSFFPNGFKGDTWYLIILLFYTTGVRVSELTGLKGGDVNFFDGNIKVLGKGNKERVIPVKKEILELIESYQEERKKEEKVTSEFLFTGRNGKPLSPASVYKIVKAILSEVTTIRKKSPHVLRHTFATHLSDHGAAINAIKELLGHSSLAATQIYTHTSIGRLKEIYKKAHPKS